MCTARAAARIVLYVQDLAYGAMPLQGLVRLQPPSLLGLPRAALA